MLQNAAPIVLLQIPPSRRLIPHVGRTRRKVFAALEIAHQRNAIGVVVKVEVRVTDSVTRGSWSWPSTAMETVSI